MRHFPEETAADGQPAWREEEGAPTLDEAHSSIPTKRTGGFFRRLISFLGPGYLVAVGYMDPGNWATSLSGGSHYGYALLFVIMLSSVMAMILQALCTRLGIATGRDLAQACRDAYPRPVAIGLWILAELAICATDLAEVIGTAIGLQLLFGIPLSLGVVITMLDVLLVLYMQSRSFRATEILVVALLMVIAICFVAQIVLARPDWAAVFGGLVPHSEAVRDPAMLYLAMGIIGATVMPHNLYLHTGIVQTRAVGRSPEERREAVRFTTIDSTVALSFAFLVNAAILVLAGAAFNRPGQTPVDDLGQAYALLAPLLGSTLAPSLFAVALLCCGLNSAITATMAGQIVMEGFVHMRLQPWLRRLITRGLAVIPAVIVTILYGEHGTSQLLILSQVVLSLQLPFAVIPLVMFTADRRKMGELRAPVWMTTLASVIAVIIVGLNLKLVIDLARGIG
ncbi:manganese transport protein [Faunimonas pinastri]|uniref:Divalent metal cation transporter MntH n=1 Tax=Faunimonas pinastri TaxID=1855383 RepID=A0A1H9MBV6_9HYPH|nr:Nramp family divalent metal transporter [Faunimonas pinastri]SER21174.1 manganese transport protein [Faunimonas pinastri]